MNLIAKLTILILLSAVQPSAYALSGELGTWLSTRAGPALAELLKHEPRFIGEQIDIVALQGDRPAAIDSVLTADISDEVRRILLAEPGIRIPLQRRGCEFTTAKIVLGIRVDRLDRNRHRVLLALLDMEENIWINRSPQVWTGRLSTGQYRRLTRPAMAATDPATGRPCQDTAISTADDHRESVTVDPQRNIQLVSDITISTRKTECRGQGRSCIDIEYEMFRDSYVFEFVTINGTLLPLDCGAMAELRFGEVRRGLKVAKSVHPDRPSLGYYVLATRLPGTAEVLNDFLHRIGNGSCGGIPEEAELQQLADIVSRDDVDWRALHLFNRHGKIRSL